MLTINIIVVILYMCICVCMCIFICMCMYVCVYIYIYIYTALPPKRNIHSIPVAIPPRCSLRIRLPKILPCPQRGTFRPIKCNNNDIQLLL